MFVALVTASAIVASGLIAIIVVVVPFVGLRSHPRASLVASFAGTAVAVAVVVIQVATPLTQRQSISMTAYIVTTYFLAMAHRLIGDAPYPFFWTPAWVYAVGSLMPLIPAGGVLALAAGYPARRAARRIAIGTMVVGSCLLLAYVTGAVYAARATWDGIPL
jgi:hypothetical protein